MITINELNIRLENFKDITKHKIMGSMLYQATKPMEEEQQKIAGLQRGQQNMPVPKRTGNLVKSIGRVRVPMAKANAIGAVRIGPRRGGQYKGYHGHLIEFGHKKVLWGRRTNERVKPYPFIEPAYRAKKDEVEGRMGSALNSVLKRWEKSGRIVEVR